MKQNYKTVDCCLNCKHCFIELELICTFYEEIPVDHIPNILTDIAVVEKYLRWIDRNRTQCNGICDNYEKDRN